MTGPLVRAQNGARGADQLLLTLAAGVALADTSIVTLALPDLETSVGTGVQGVAAVLFVYTAVLALALPLAARQSTPKVAGAGFALAAGASVICALAPSLGVLLAGRGLQAAGGALGLVGVFGALDGGASGRRWWVAASVFGVAVGPALGGVLTQALGWRSIFVVQAPVAALAALVMLHPRRASAWAGVGARSAAGGGAATDAPAGASSAGATDATGATQRGTPEGQVAAPVRPARALVALALVSASLSAVLFGLVLLVVAGWSKSPLSAAVALTVLPLGALAGALVRGPARARAVAGSVLIGSGVLSLAFIPQAHLTWTLFPQALAGVGMGLALTGLSGSLLAERTPGDAARLLSVRHAGIALLLVVLAPLIAHQLTRSTDQARLRGMAVVLDARLAPQAKLALAPGLLGAVNGDQPRGRLLGALAAARGDFHGSALTEFDRVGHSADDTLLAAVGNAFKAAFLLAGGVALLAALVLSLGRSVALGGRARSRPTRVGVVLTGLLVCALVPAAYAAAQSTLAPAPVLIRDPCRPRVLPGVGGLTGALQDRALRGLDALACRLHTSREEIVLAFVDPAEGKRFAAAHPGYDPSQVTNLLGGLLGAGGLGGLLGLGGP